jgi:CRP/FNR family transcriptional regulator, cyclic AMP receptor protein
VTKLRKASFDAEAFFAEAGKGKTISQYRKNQLIFRQGDAADAVYYVQKGKVKLLVTSDRGKEGIIAILGPSDFIGEGCLNGQQRRIATAAAVDECVITRIERKAMIAAMHAEEKISELFIAFLLARKTRIEEDLVDQLFNSSEKRLARILLLLANLGKEGRHEPIVGNFSQEILAEMVGTTRSRVSFFMNKFRKLGFIDYNGTLEVHSSLLTVILHDTSPDGRHGRELVRD